MISLIYQKAISDFKAEARRGSLGILWWVIEPLLYVLVFYVIFTLIFQRGSEGSVLNLLTGLVVWKWFDSSIRQSANSITTNVGLIRQVYLPKVMLPAMVIVTTTLKFFIIFIMLLAFLIFQGHEPSATWLAIPIIIVVQAVVIFAIGGFLAAIVPFLPDLRLLIDNGMTLLFFLSGIFFDINNVNDQLQSYLNTNPMVGIIDSYRLVLLNNQWPDFRLLLTTAVFSSLLLFLAYFILTKYDREYMKVL